LYDSLSLFFMRQYGDSATNRTQAVTFLNGPRDEVGPLQDYWNNAVPTGSKRNMYAGPDSGKGTWDSTQVPWDFRYSNTNPLYTAGVDGKPVGALFVHGLTVGVKEPETVPEGFSLSQNFPNPFNPSTRISYSLKKQTAVKLEVFNGLGQLVKTLVDASQGAGTYETVWNGTNESGGTLASGVYVYRLSGEQFTVSRTMVLLK
jgi:hypothetical protein